jgi:uncharacterized protein (DUF4415 family)
MKKRYDRELTIDELKKMSDSDIDYSDIAETDIDFWQDAIIVPPQTKPSVTLRLDDDVLQYFKRETPKGFTSHMAAVLKSYVEAHRDKG